MSSKAVHQQQYGRDDLESIDGEPVTLNLGCGEDATGVGIDIHYNPDIKHDLNGGIPVEDGAADRILANHVLEHIDNPTKLLDECARVLAPGGELSIEVPNVGWLPVRVWISQDLHRFWQHKAPERDGHWLARRLGRTDPERTAHKTLWTKALLAEYLDAAGFDYRIEGSHLGQNLRARAWLDGATGSGPTLHELERDAGGDLATDDYWAQTRARIMTRWIDERDPERVIDLGCGSGYLTATVAEADPTRTVIGIDTDADSIEVARRRGSPASFHVADAFDLDYAADSFDCVVLGDVIEHFEDPTPMLDEARRVLTPGGYCIISVPAFRFLFGPHDEHNDHHDRYTARRLAAVAEETGFEPVRHRYTNAVPLPVYWFYQRVLERPVPKGARGGHSRVVEWLKRRLISVETRVPFPIGITLIAEFSAGES